MAPNVGTVYPTRRTQRIRGISPLPSCRIRCRRFVTVFQRGPNERTRPGAGFDCVALLQSVRQKVALHDLNSRMGEIARRARCIKQESNSAYERSHGARLVPKLATREFFNDGLDTTANAESWATNCGAQLRGDFNSATSSRSNRAKVSACGFGRTAGRPSFTEPSDSAGENGRATRFRGMMLATPSARIAAA